MTLRDLFKCLQIPFSIGLWDNDTYICMAFIDSVVFEQFLDRKIMYIDRGKSCDDGTIIYDLKIVLEPIEKSED